MYGDRSLWKLIINLKARTDDNHAAPVKSPMLLY
jgi:hypothetical protein